MSNSETCSKTIEDVISKTETFGIQETGCHEEQQNQIEYGAQNHIESVANETVTVIEEKVEKVPALKDIGHTEPVLTENKMEDQENGSFSGVMETEPNQCGHDLNMYDCSGSSNDNITSGDKCPTDKSEEQKNNSFENQPSDDSDSEDDYVSAEEDNDIAIDEQGMLELEKNLTEEEKIERKTQAQAHKEEGNKLFKEHNYKEAVKCYGKALRLCPVAFPKDRSIMYSNRAACWMKLEQNDQAIVDSTSALDLHPHYLKALLRRAQLYEKGDKLDEALADYQRVIELDPSDHSARAACMRLPDLIKERNEKMKEEMMDKLKDIGNMILRPFGLSTNNFQMQKNPETGGYSVQFQQNPGNGK